MKCHSDRALSVDLDFTGNPKDLMTKFVDCLARLPNLRTLDIFSASHIGPITRGLRRKCARFPGIRELWIDRTLIKFIGSCPNVESITTTDGLCWKSAEVLGSHGKGLKKLKRVAWIYGENLLRGKHRETRSCWRRLFTTGAVTEVVQGCPDLQEVCIRGTMTAVGRPVVGPQREEHPDLHTYRSSIGHRCGRTPAITEAPRCCGYQFYILPTLRRRIGPSGM